MILTKIIYIKWFGGLTIIYTFHGFQLTKEAVMIPVLKLRIKTGWTSYSWYVQTTLNIILLSVVLVNSSAKNVSVELYLYCFNILVNLFVLSMCCITMKLSSLKSVKHANLLDKDFYEYVNFCIGAFGFSHWKECVCHCVKSVHIRSYSGPKKTKNKKAKRIVLVKSLKNASKIKRTVLHQVGVF